MAIHFEYITKEEGMWPLVLYSPSLNVVISAILKNGTSALETWAKLYDFETISYKNKSKIIEGNSCPELITILRDPVERAISAIHMLQTHQRRFGLNVSWENYTNIHLAYEPHIMPQSCYVPVLPNSNDKELGNYTRMWDDKMHNPYTKGWTDFLNKYDVIGRLTDKNKFFYIDEGEDITVAIVKYLNQPPCSSFSKHNSYEYYGPTKPKISEEYRKYLEEAYQYDYKLINSVKFINK
jgi:hypothetical protein